MNSIENYLQTLDKKNLIMLYLSVVVVFLIIYYNFNYSYLNEKIKTGSDKIALLKSKYAKNEIYEKKLARLKKLTQSLKKENLSLSEDLRYLNVLIKTSDVLHINDRKFLNILEEVLFKASINDIQASYTISKELNDYKIYQIDINGTFDASEFGNFNEFIKNMESVKSINEIKFLKFYLNKDKKNVYFEIKYYLWGLL